MSTRSDCLAQLKTNLEAVTQLVTVVLSNEDPGGVGGYTRAELPIAIIKPEGESVTYETSRFGYWKTRVSLFIYFLADDVDESDRETLVSAVKNKIGEDPTLNGLCEMCQITGLLSSGSYPLYKETISLEFDYEQSISVA